jgi:hypothetical protein
MSTSHKSSRIERIGGAVVLAVLAAFALYIGVSALVTGQFFESGARSNPVAVTLVTGTKAYLAGAFVASVGATLLVLLVTRGSPARMLRASLLINAALFFAAVLSYVLAK